MPAAEPTPVILAVGGVFLVTWYGLSRLRVAPPPSLERTRGLTSPAGSTDSSRVPAALISELRHSRSYAGEFAPGGMVMCPHCGVDFPAGTLYCDCGEETVEIEDLEDLDEFIPLTSETTTVSIEDEESEEQDLELVCVYVAENRWKAALLKSFLESHDIPCATGGNGLGGAYAFSNLPMAQVRILVHASNAEEARNLLKKVA